MGNTTQITYTNLRIPLDSLVFAAVSIDNPLEISISQPIIHIGNDGEEGRRIRPEIRRPQ